MIVLSNLVITEIGDQHGIIRVLRRIVRLSCIPILMMAIMSIKSSSLLINESHSPLIRSRVITIDIIFTLVWFLWRHNIIVVDKVLVLFIYIDILIVVLDRLTSLTRISPSSPVRAVLRVHKHEGQQ